MKIRVRDPFVAKQVEEVTEKWLIIDKFERSLQPPVIIYIDLITALLL